jgi:tRNA1Val (adenine37-N6)-methyltransferase
LFCFHAGLDEFVDEPEDEYDLIISNPPFYSEDYKQKIHKEI